MIGSYSLSEIAERCKGQIFGDNVEVSCFSSDTRSLTFGDAFIALKGKNFDGNDLIDDAIGKGAVALVVSKKLSCKLPL
ncbi:MAG: Mur ligase domain-containing protein, partial [Pseudohongiellaceae bacterium]